MGNEKRIVFDPFSLDLANEQLWRGSEKIKLRPKAFAVLDHLISRPGQLVTKDDLLNAVWPGTFIGDAVLKVVIRQIREALDDDPKTPRFIETAHRRGYRFIGQIEGGKPAAEQSSQSTSSASPSLQPAAYTPPGVVGRAEALSRMRGWLEGTLAGERQIIFVTGEPGIGKTSLVDTFAKSLDSDPRVRIGRGQCLEQYGTGEPYLPVLEAMGRLCREQPEVVEVLRACAPMWLLQMPALVSPADRELLTREVSGASRERMLREMGEALEALTVTQPLVLILEDLHWSDYSTLDLISYLARQRQPTQLMLIGTYRPVELIVSGHPLKAVKQELLANKQCKELPLEYLSESRVAEYLAVRFPDNRFPAELARLIHDRTEGNPLFMVNAVDYLVVEGLIGEDQNSWGLAVKIENVEVGVPDSIRQMIEKQIDRLGAEEQRTLETASAAGAKFSAFAVSCALGADRALVDDRCAELARRHLFIRDAGVQELPNQEVVSRYSFIHALYQNVLYERVPASKRVELHRRIGEQGEAVYGERAREIAGELAMHFERGANYATAANYLQQASENAILHCAYQEAVGLARRGLELIGRLPDTPERAQQELSLQLTLGVPLIATAGYAAPEVGNAYIRARELCHRLGEAPEMLQVLWGLWSFLLLKTVLGTALDIAKEFLRLAERLGSPGRMLRGHVVMEVTLMHLGEFDRAGEHLEQGLLLHDREGPQDDAFRYTHNPEVAIRCHGAWTLWFLGYPDQAVRRVHEAITRARELAEPHGLAHAFFFAAMLHQLRRESGPAREHARACFEVSREHGLLLYEALSMIARGWSLIDPDRHEEAIAELLAGLVALEATGTEVLRAHFLGLLVEALAQSGQLGEGLSTADEALELAVSNKDRYYEAELYRLKGELLRVTDPISAKVCFDRSLAIAQEQKAKSWELRTALSLARFDQSRSKQKEARALLTQIYGTFTEGFATADLLEAKALLNELSDSKISRQPGSAPA